MRVRKVQRKKFEGRFLFGRRPGMVRGVDSYEGTVLGLGTFIQRSKTLRTAYERA